MTSIRESLTSPTQKQDQKQEQILQGAMQVFLQDGYAGTSMDRVAIKALVSKQTIYSHFQDKEGLFKALIERITINRYQQIFISEFSNSAQPTEPSVFLRQLANTYFSKVASDSDYLSLLRIVIGESSRFPELAKLYAQTVIHSGRKLLTEYFDSHPELNLGDAEYMAHIFMGSLVSFIVVQEIMHTQEIMPMSSEQLVSNLVDLFLSKSDNKLMNF